ncbi:hypothetical protein EYF80_047035 [Liparis tanakae]|uniref:Uncharacterized protein n=1 Tax=Liparis tanakae TaxID=230148 RepID=A0A4Z2FNF9_9TELE|nr:hypothetical protein EYF80_047035 [Liparis tanakae]
MAKRKKSRDLAVRIKPMIDSEWGAHKSSLRDAERGGVEGEDIMGVMTWECPLVIRLGCTGKESHLSVVVET